MLRCLGCDLHLSVRRGAGSPEAYYDSLDSQAYQDYYGPFRRRVFAGNWQRIVRWCANGRALDIGASYGWFPEVAPADWRAEGVEPSEKVAAEARARGLNVRTGELTDLPAAERFDLITLWNVFEHLPNPVRSLADIRDRLFSGGLLALCVPNRSGLFNRLGYLGASVGVRGPLEALYQTASSAPHRFHYRVEDLTSLLERNGFEVLAWHGQPIVDATNLVGRARLEKGSSIAGTPVGRLLMRGIMKVSGVTGLSDEIAIYARKTSSTPR